MANSKTRKALAFCLAAMMAASTLTACGGNETASKDETGSTTSGSETASEGDGGVVTLTFLQVGSGLTEEDNSLVTKKVAENIGVNVQPMVVNEDRLNVMMASGDMEADLITSAGGTGEDVSQRLIEGGLVQPLDDLIEQYGPDIKENASEMLDFAREFCSYGQNKVFFVRSNTGPYEELAQKNRPYNYGVAPFIRWDYYKELGSPDVTNEDEFLQMLRDMQDLHPQNDQGQATYAMSLTLTDLWNIFTFYSLCNDRGYIGGYYTNRDGATNDLVSNVLKEDDVVWRTLSYYNKAWRLGILDPESFTQKGENVTEKATTSRMFYTENSWNSYNSVLMENVGENAGFEPMYTAFPTVYGGDEGNYGWNYQVGISAKSENPEAAMKWINYLYNPDGARLRRNGIEGIHWEYVDGVPTIMEDVWENKADEDWQKENGLNIYGNWVGLAGCLEAPDGYAYDLNYTVEALKRNNLPVDTAYCEEFGAEYPGQVPDVLDSENGTVRFYYSDIPNMMSPKPDDLNRITSKADDILLKASPNMIMAETEEEFNQLRDETIKSLEDIGIQQVIDWATEEYNSAREKLGV